MTTQVVLYGHPGCCLCDAARAVLERVRPQFPFELREVDIDADELLFRTHLERIPVVEIDGAEAFTLFVDEAALRARLRRGTEAAATPQ